MRISDWSSDVCSSDLPTATSQWSCRAKRMAVRPEHSASKVSALGIIRLIDVAVTRRRRKRAISVPHPGGRSRRTAGRRSPRSEEHTSELQSLMRISYAVFCLKKKKQNQHKLNNNRIEHH